MILAGRVAAFEPDRARIDSRTESIGTGRNPHASGSICRLHERHAHTSVIS